MIEDFYKDLEVKFVKKVNFPNAYGFDFTTESGESGSAYSVLKIHNNEIHIVWIQAIPTGNGYGTILMNSIVEAADKNQVNLILLASNEKLINFYERLGFVKTDRPGKMTRLYREKV